MISDLYNSRMSVIEISSEYSIAKSTINGWIKNNKNITYIKTQQNGWYYLASVLDLHSKK
ncbi:hypothetical protein [Clostridium massiliamazoniense]|uniref:hypothetical protein n=1 Tax=Clostridium massiliamazoniense TaxID=1347366 RepID=UPI0006D7816E|nr:hypothetical protein [Clostridium massiliamazoniense]